MDLLQLALAALSGGIVALLLTVFGGGGSVLAEIFCPPASA